MRWPLYINACRRGEAIWTKPDFSSEVESVRTFAFLFQSQICCTIKQTLTLVYSQRIFIIGTPCPRMLSEYWWCGISTADIIYEVLHLRYIRPIYGESKATKHFNVSERSYKNTVRIFKHHSAEGWKPLLKLLKFLLWWSVILHHMDTHLFNPVQCIMDMNCLISQLIITLSLLFQITNCAYKFPTRMVQDQLD